jgi:hypothetical protein
MSTARQTLEIAESGTSRRQDRTFPRRPVAPSAARLRQLKSLTAAPIEPAATKSQKPTTKAERTELKTSPMEII